MSTTSVASFIRMSVGPIPRPQVRTADLRVSQLSLGTRTTSGGSLASELGMLELDEDRSAELGSPVVGGEMPTMDLHPDVAQAAEGIELDEGFALTARDLPVNWTANSEGWLDRRMLLSRRRPSNFGDLTAAFTRHVLEPMAESSMFEAQYGGV